MWRKQGEGAAAAAVFGVNTLRVQPASCAPVLVVAVGMLKKKKKKRIQLGLNPAEYTIPLT